MWLCGLIFLAGFVDSIVGGGGLITIPAFMILVPELPVTTMFGTNKTAAIMGTSVSAYRYSKEVNLNWRVLWPALVTSLIAAVGGAQCVSLISREVVRPLVFILLIAVAVYTFIRKDFGMHHRHHHTETRAKWLGAVFGALIGFYDGFFGPGTGSFFIFFFVGVFGYDFLHASAAAKILNVAANATAVIWFAFTGNVIWPVALLIAVFNMAGAWLGVRVAIKQGSRFVRILFLVVVSALILKLGWDMFGA
ncbi:MAG: TSUP family transporter [Bacteroidia bacterium]|nr:TSUP family transporter [Bacteroidia bacterium]